MKKIEKKDWKTEPLSADFDVLNVVRIFDKNRMDMLRYGSKPYSMDDKWFIYCENDTLYFHRSWTGICVFEVDFYETEEGSWRVKQCRVFKCENSNERDETWNASLVSDLIDDVIAANTCCIKSNL